MAKQTGLGDSLLIAGYDISGDIGALGRIGKPSGVLDVTAINASGHERIHSHVDGAIEFNHFWNVATDQEHDVLAAKGSGADRIVTYLHGATIGNMAAGLVSKQITYDLTRGADGSLTGQMQCLGADFGLDYCEQLTAGLRTDTEATNGASLNNGAATSVGLAAYLQITAFDGTDVTVAIEDSANGTDFTALTGGAFAQASAVGAQRIVTALDATVRQYLRVVTTGTFTSVTFSVVVTRAPHG